MLLLSEILGTPWVTEQGPPDPNIPTFPQGITTENLGSLIGIAGSIQQQLDAKSPIGHRHDDLYHPLSGDLVTEDDIPYLSLNGGYF